MNIKRVFAVAIVGLAFGLVPTVARAAPVSVDFCPSAECTSDGYSSVTLTFTEIADADPNNYTVDVDVTWIAYTGTDNLAAVQISIDAANKSTDYESVALTDAPGGTGAWTTTFGTVNNAGCNQNGNPADPCSFWTTGVGFVMDNSGGTAHFEYTIDLVDGIQFYTNGVNVRLTRNGNSQFQSQFSPGGSSIDGFPVDGGGDGVPVDGGGDGVPVDGTPAPEPTSLLLLGSAFAVVANRLRRRSPRA